MAIAMTKATKAVHLGGGLYLAHVPRDEGGTLCFMRLIDTTDGRLVRLWDDSGNAKAAIGI